MYFSVLVWGAWESLAECWAAASLTFKAETRALSIPPAPLVAGREARWLAPNGPLAHGNMGRQVRAVALVTTGTQAIEKGTGESRSKIDGEMETEQGMQEGY